MTELKVIQGKFSKLKNMKVKGNAMKHAKKQNLNELLEELKSLDKDYIFEHSARFLRSEAGLVYKEIKQVLKEM